MQHEGLHRVLPRNRATGKNRWRGRKVQRRRIPEQIAGPEQAGLGQQWGGDVPGTRSALTRRPLDRFNRDQTSSDRHAHCRDNVKPPAGRHPVTMVLSRWICLHQRLAALRFRRRRIIAGRTHLAGQATTIFRSAPRLNRATKAVRILTESPATSLRHGLAFARFDQRQIGQHRSAAACTAAPAWARRLW